MPVLSDLDGAVIDSSADYLPLVYWPDGSWCVEANRFIRSRYERGCSRKNKGGTLKQLASQLAPLLRFCWEHRIAIQDLSDSDFRRFILSIIPTPDASQSRENSRNAESTYIRQVGRTCLAMLQNMAEHADDPGFVGPSGQIRAYARKVTHVQVRGGSKHKRMSTVLHHDALPMPSAKRTRRPVTDREIELLRKAAEDVAADVVQQKPSEHRAAMFVLQRRLLCIRLLECTPPRRGEVADLRVSSVAEAARMHEPMLRMTTLKKASEKARLVPVTRTLLRALLAFDEMERQPLLRRLGKPDHDYLFVNSVTGEPLDWDSITQDVRFLARRAGIPHAVTPHMFRHRFITKLFVDLIQLHDLRDIDALRRLLLSTEDLLIKVQQWTGHRSIDSLRVYIHEAFSEVSGLKRSLDLVRLKQAVEALAGSIEDDVRLARLGRFRRLELLDRVGAQLNEFRKEVAWAELAEAA